MGRMKENPRCNVVSIRLTDEEMEMLKRVTALSEQNVSELVRQAVLNLRLPDVATGVAP